MPQIGWLTLNEVIGSCSAHIGQVAGPLLADWEEKLAVIPSLFGYCFLANRSEKMEAELDLWNHPSRKSGS